MASFAEHKSFQGLCTERIPLSLSLVASSCKTTNNMGWLCNLKTLSSQKSIVTAGQSWTHLIPTMSKNTKHCQSFLKTGYVMIPAMACYYNHLLDHWNSISSVREVPSRLVSGTRLYWPLIVPSITTLSIWMVTFPKEPFPKVLSLLQDMCSFWPLGGMSKAHANICFHSGDVLRLTTCTHFC